MSEFKEAQLILLGELKEARRVTKSEFEKLNKRIDALEQKVDSIRYPRMKLAGGGALLSLLAAGLTKYLEHK